ncbi:reverse transcriptase domain-containing protein [Tanacetum coccineum]
MIKVLVAEGMKRDKSIEKGGALSAWRLCASGKEWLGVESDKLTSLVDDAIGSILSKASPMVKWFPLGSEEEELRSRNQHISESRTMSGQEDKDFSAAQQPQSKRLYKFEGVKVQDPTRHNHKEQGEEDKVPYSENFEGGHWKSKSRRQKSNVEDDNLSQPWVCAETDPFTYRIRHFDFPKTRMPSHVKTYNGSEDPENHLKIFKAAAKTEMWAMLTWCHMFKSTLTGNARVWFDDLPPESINSYNDLREAFLKNYLQQKKCIKDPIVLHNIKQRDGEST